MGKGGQGTGMDGGVGKGRAEGLGRPAGAAGPLANLLGLSTCVEGLQSKLAISDPYWHQLRLELGTVKCWLQHREAESEAQPDVS